MFRDTPTLDRDDCEAANAAANRAGEVERAVFDDLLRERNTMMLIASDRAVDAAVETLRERCPDHGSVAVTEDDYDGDGRRVALEFRKDGLLSRFSAAGVVERRPTIL